ncbi:hypothetical protein PAECIP111891_02180 [Paenibacillus allorhizoplanae]|uniref:Head-tail adaptor protein n=1 Tax=Paenibacillus allorhizoplanae TaxID=2905648 RepID=A0ABN8GAZ6_9BACL|nr:hypothetical protein [Paenibacillus allorhizoplanae]CAH1202970.1 hypothetical protein PAECIP111891_02180 [Paenibacillus allorhizoplanae]
MGFGNVAAERAAIEMTYEGRCTVTELQLVKDPVTKVTGQQRVIALLDEPCAVSQTALRGVTSTDTDNTIDYDAKLFISPDVSIRAGSEINVIQDGMDIRFQQVGKPFRYTTHQEIMLNEVGRA